MFIIECAIRGSAEKWQIHTQWSHFLRLAVTVDFDDISLEKYGQLIIKLDQGTLGMSDPLQLTFDQLGTDRTS